MLTIITGAMLAVLVFLLIVSLLMLYIDKVVDPKITRSTVRMSGPTLDDVLNQERVFLNQRPGLVIINRSTTRIISRGRWVVEITYQVK
jgi:hypothetical protein